MENLRNTTADFSKDKSKIRLNRTQRTAFQTTQRSIDSPKRRKITDDSYAINKSSTLFRSDWNRTITPSRFNKRPMTANIGTLQVQSALD